MASTARMQAGKEKRKEKKKSLDWHGGIYTVFRYECEDFDKSKCKKIVKRERDGRQFKSAREAEKAMKRRRDKRKRAMEAEAQRIKRRKEDALEEEARTGVASVSLIEQAQA